MDRLLIEVLEDKHKITMLLFLLENAPCKKTDIYEGRPNSNLKEKLDELAEASLIIFEQKKFENNITTVELTKLGRDVAKKLMDIENLLNGIRPEGDGPNLSAPGEQGGKIAGRG